MSRVISSHVTLMLHVISSRVMMISSRVTLMHRMRHYFMGLCVTSGCPVRMPLVPWLWAQLLHSTGGRDLPLSHFQLNPSLFASVLLFLLNLSCLVHAISPETTEKVLKLSWKGNGCK